jgi:hypothetical protein
MRELRQTSIRIPPGRLVFFIAVWLVVLLAYEALISPRFHLPYLWDEPVFSAPAWMSLVLVIWPPLARQSRFWIAVTVGLAVQVLTEQVWLRRGRSWWDKLSPRTFPGLGLLVWGVAYSLLWLRARKRAFRNDTIVIAEGAIAVASVLLFKRGRWKHHRI